MRRVVGTLFATALLALGMTSCAAPEPVPADSEAPPPTSAPASPGAEAADALCASGEGGGDACVITAQTAAEDLSFAGYEVVKIVDSTLQGAVTVDGVGELVVTNTRFGADLTVTGVDGVVIKLSDVAGSLVLSDAEHAALVQNTVAGDLRCEGVSADGDGNRVTGTNTCPTR